MARNTSKTGSNTPEEPEDDYWESIRRDIVGSLTPTTTTTVPRTGGVLFPGFGKKPPSTGGLLIPVSEEEESRGTQLQRDIESEKQRAYMAPGYTAEEVEDIAAGKKESKGITFGKVFRGIFDYTIGLPFTGGKFALEKLDELDNSIIALAEGSIKNAKVITAAATGKDPEARYKNQSDIPVNKQTQIPIARVGDLALANEDELINYEIEIPVNKKLMTPDIAIKATNDMVNKFGTRSTTERYESVDEIPVHKQTLQPLAKVGDFKITNDFAIANMAVRGVDPTYILPSDVQDIYEQYAKDRGKYKRAIANPSDVWKNIQDPRYGARNYIIGSPTGIGWLDATIGFAADVALAPSTYLTFGTGTAAKVAIGNLDNAAVYVDDAARIMIEGGTKKSVNEALDVTARKIAEDIGEKATSRTVQRLSAAVVADAANIVRVAADDKLAAQAVKEADNLTKVADLALKRWSAIGPQRVVGASNREALAISVRAARENAASEALRYAGTARGRAAQNFVDVITDEVIADIATRGYPALKGKVAEVLGTPGGIRFGVGTAKVTLPGTRGVQMAGSQVGRGVRALGTGGKVAGRQVKGIGTVKVPFARRTLLELVTPQGRGGLPIVDDLVFEARTGLRSGRLRGNTPAAMAALDLIAEDDVYKSLKKTAGATIKQGLTRIFQEHPNPESRVNSNLILNNTYEELDALFSEGEDAAARILSDMLGVTVTPQQVAFNMDVVNYLRNLGTIIDDLGLELNLPVINSLSNPDAVVFPQVLTDKGVSFLGTKTAQAAKAIDPATGQPYKMQDIIDRTLLGLGFDTRPVAGQNILNEVGPGSFFFGTFIPTVNADGTPFTVSIDYLNKIARENLGIKFDLFDTNIKTVLTRYSNKFAGEYAFAQRMANISGPEAVNRLRQEVEAGVDETGMPRVTGLVPEARTQTPVTTGQVFSTPQMRGIDFGRKSVEILQRADDINIIASAQQSINSALSPQPIVSNVTPEQLGTVVEALTPLATSIGVTAFDLPRVLEAVGTAVRTLGTDAVSSRDLERIVAPVLNRIRSERRLSEWTTDRILRVAQSLDERLRTIDGMLQQRRVPKNMSADELIDTQRALGEIRDIIDIYEVAKQGDLEYAQVWGAIGADLADKYEALFAQKPELVEQFINNINPKTLDTMVNIFEDGFVLINNMIVPDIAVRADLAVMFNNIQRLRDPRMQSAFTRFVRDSNRTFKAWVTSVPGFHVRNFISNAWQMVAAGAEMKNMVEGRKILSEWNTYVKKLITEGVDVDNPAKMVDDFVKQLDAPKGVKDAVRKTFLESGSVGVGDLEEVFGQTLPESMGILGRQTERELSQRLAAPIRASRRAGGWIEDYSRFILTYDGIRQGLDPRAAAARTRRFLFDYEDMSILDERMKVLLPFWVWMSRNLPLQMQEMFHNPRLYQQYNQFRANFEDENGDNVLMPSWLRKAGAFSISGNVLLKPDLGIPGAGAPSPLMEGITDPRQLLGSLTPILRVPYEIVAGEKASTGQELEGFTERYITPAFDFVPQASWLGRFLNLPLGGRFEEPIIPGVAKKKSDTTPAEVRRNAILSLLGLPVTVVTPSQENQRRYEILQELRRITGG